MKNIRTRAWIGMYKTGELGWLAPTFLEPGGNTSLSLEQSKMLAGKENYYPGDLYRVEMTIKLVRDKKGNLITRRNKKFQKTYNSTKKPKKSPVKLWKITQKGSLING